MNLRVAVVQRDLETQAVYQTVSTNRPQRRTYNAFVREEDVPVGVVDALLVEQPGGEQLRERAAAEGDGERGGCGGRGGDRSDGRAEGLGQRRVMRCGAADKQRAGAAGMSGGGARDGQRQCQLSGTWSGSAADDVRWRLAAKASAPKLRTSATAPAARVPAQYLPSSTPPITAATQPATAGPGAAIGAAAAFRPGSDFRVSLQAGTGHAVSEPPTGNL